MKEQIYIGIDLAKGSSKVAALDSSGEAIFKPFTITNSKEGVKKLLLKLSSYHREQIVCGMEIKLQLLGEYVLIPKRDGYLLYPFKPLPGKEIQTGCGKKDQN